MIHPVSLIAVVAGLAATSGFPNRAAAGSDGRWSVELTTESGLCSPRYTCAVAIDGGQVRLASGGADARVGGRVGPDGSVGLTVSNGTATGTGTGHLTGSRGAGTWKVSALCSGRWTARRSGGETAQAE